MEGFSQEDGFLQTNYYDQPNTGYDMGGGQFGQDPQFGQFDYGQQGYTSQQQTTYAQQTSYTGSILSPDTQQAYTPSAVDNFEDEPPLMEELGINFDHIVQKTLAVLNPLKHPDTTIMQDTDLAGPLVFCLAFGGALMLTGKLHFGYIYGLGVLGCLAMYCLLNLMSLTGVSVGCIISVLGYCLLPMVFLSFSSIILSLQGMSGTIITCLAVLWCSVSASNLFVSALGMDQQQLLVAYPCALVYAVFALLTVF